MMADEDAELAEIQRLFNEFDAKLRQELGPKLDTGGFYAEAVSPRHRRPTRHAGGVPREAQEEREFQPAGGESAAPGEAKEGSAAEPGASTRAVERRRVRKLETGRRRARRWGEAARKAAQSEIADGKQWAPRSLRAVREAFPLSQRELALRARLSRGTVGALESGKRRAHPKTRRMIARVLGVEAGEIAWG